jgi:hypothetical protein
MEIRGVPDETERINLIAYLRTLSDRRLPEAWLLPGGDPNDKTLVPVPNEARQHAKACLEALDEWEAVIEARGAEVRRWEAKTDRLHKLQLEACEQIAELPALTAEGVKASSALWMQRRPLLRIPA